MLGEKERVPVWSWIFTFIVLAIPIVNVVYFIVLLFGGSKYDSKVTFIRAQFFVVLIAIGLLLVIGLLAFDEIMELLQPLLDYIQAYIDQFKGPVAK